jgi:hypothetical protein
VLVVVRLVRVCVGLGRLMMMMMMMIFGESLDERHCVRQILGPVRFGEGI